MASWRWLGRVVANITEFNIVIHSLDGPHLSGFIHFNFFEQLSLINLPLKMGLYNFGDIDSINPPKINNPTTQKYDLLLAKPLPKLNNKDRYQVKRSLLNISKKTDDIAADILSRLRGANNALQLPNILRVNEGSPEFNPWELPRTEIARKEKERYNSFISAIEIMERYGQIFNAFNTHLDENIHLEKAFSLGERILTQYYIIRNYLEDLHNCGLRVEDIIIMQKFLDLLNDFCQYCRMSNTW